MQINQTAKVLTFLFLSLNLACATTKVSDEKSENKKDDAVVAKNSARTTPPPSSAQSEGSSEYHFSMAQAYVADGNSERAIEEFKLALVYDPTSSLLHVRLATEYLKKGLLTEAMESCKAALSLDSDYIDARLILAGLYAMNRENENALQEYERVLKSSPTHDEAAVYRAQTLVDLGRSAEAVKGLKAFMQKQPDSVVGWYYLGRIEQSIDHPKEAEIAYKKAISLRPSFTQAGMALGSLYETTDRNAKAIEIYKGIYDETQDATAAQRISSILLKEEKFKEVLPYLEAMRVSDPDDMNVQVKLGLVQMELKNYANAIKTFRTILEKHPESDRVNYYLGSLYEELDQNDLSIYHLSKIGPESKLYSESALHVSFLLKKQGKISEAKSFIDGAIAKAPQYSSFYLFKASIEEESKNEKGAIAILEKVQDRFSDDEKVHYYLGSLYDRAGDSDKGIFYMEKVLKINPQNPDALNYMGYTWTKQGVRMSDAERALKKAMELRPNNGYIQDSWGYHLFIRGKVRESIVELEKAVRLKPEEAVILEHLGDAYAKSNLKQKALEKYQEAVQHAESQQDKMQIQKKIDTLKGGTASERLPASEE